MKETPDQEIQKIDEELKILYGEHADLIKKQNLLYAEIEKKQGEQQ